MFRKCCKRALVADFREQQKEKQFYWACLLLSAVRNHHNYVLPTCIFSGNGNEVKKKSYIRFNIVQRFVEERAAV